MLAIVLLAKTFVAMGVPSVSFQPARTNTLPNPAYGAAVADFNNDSNLDLIFTTFATPSDGTIVFGNGDGTFGGSTNIPVGNGSGQIMTTDLNHDGNADFIIASAGFTVGLGNGDGTFQIANYSSAGGNEVNLGDYNADGVADLIIPGVNTTVVFPGLGNGTFGPATNYYFSTTVNANACESIALGNFGQNAFPGMVAMADGGGPGIYPITIYSGLGGGSYSRTTQFLFNFPPAFFLTNDFNNDGNIDILALSPNQPIILLLGDGHGNFTMASTNPPTKLGIVSTACVGDFNGDGFLDFATAPYNANTCQIYLNQGDGTFSLGLSIPIPMLCETVATGDFNGDGRPDLVVGTSNPAGFLILLNQTFPNLQIQNNAGVISLNWPNWPGFALEQNSDLTSSVGWNVVTNSPTLAGNMRSLIVSPQTQALFYRLQQIP
jgi:hypothetical protein